MLLFVIIFLLACFFALLYATYRVCFYSPDKTQNNVYNIPQDGQFDPVRARMQELIAEIEAEPFEEVSITSLDGLKLYGRYYHRADGAPLDIGFHGWRGTAFRDMCGGASLGRRMGHNLLLIDQRAHGKSEGHTISYGINERWDCLMWIEYARRRFGNDVRIMLCGVSMGATTVLMASQFNIADNVYAIFADCPYSSPKEIILKVCRDSKIPPRVAWPFIYLSARIFGKFDLNEITAAQAVKASTIPIVIVHGLEDRFVPHEMSAVITGDNVTRHTFEHAGHGLSGLCDSPRYDDIVFGLVEKHCPK